MIAFITVTVISILTYSSITTHSHVYTYSFESFDRGRIASILYEQLKKNNFVIPDKMPEEISILPGYPTASFTALNQPVIYINETTDRIPVYIFRDITVYGKSVVSYNPATGKKYVLNDVVIKAMGEKYRDALEYFYFYIKKFEYGIPPGTYDPSSIVGIKKLDLPDPPVLKARLKPKLLLVMIGCTDGSWVTNPIYIYYFGFEVPGETFEGVFTRVTIVLSIVIDEYRSLYVGDVIAHVGLTYYYAIGSTAPLPLAVPITIVHGFIGLLIAFLINYVEFEDEYKYYIILFLVFIAETFGFAFINVIAKITTEQLIGVILSIGPWFILIHIIWVVPYIITTYRYYSNPEIKHEVTSPYEAVFEGVLLAFCIGMISLLIVFIAPAVQFMVARIGVSGVYFVLVFIALIILYVGTRIGKLWAFMRRYA